MLFLIIIGSLFGFLAIGNFVSGYGGWGTAFAGLSLGAFFLAALTYSSREQPDSLPHSSLSRSSPPKRERQADVESRYRAAVHRLVTIFGDTQDQREIIRRLERELERDNKDAEVWHALSQSYGEAGEGRRAFEAATTALRLNPSEGRYHFTVSSMHMMVCAEADAPGEPEGLGVTPRELGMTYNEAIDKAEFHARETLRLGALSPFEVQARENLFTLRLMREMSPE